MTGKLEFDEFYDVGDVILLEYDATDGQAEFMLFMAKELSAFNILNAPFAAAEILNILVGSFGLITVAPFTVLVSRLLYRRR